MQIFNFLNISKEYQHNIGIIWFVHQQNDIKSTITWKLKIGRNQIKHRGV